MSKIVAKENRNIIQNDFLKRILVISIIITNLFFYIPNVTFAADDDKEKTPALVPAVAEQIISKYVSVKTSSSTSGDSDNSSGENIITNNSEKGDGWSSTTTVKSESGVERTYRNYKQNEGSYKGNQYWDGDIASDGCGPTSMAIVLSGYGYDYNPGDFVDKMEQRSSDSFSNLTKTLKNIASIDSEEHTGGFSKDDLQKIRDNFNAGRPVVVNAPNHYIVLLGEDKDRLIISDPGDMSDQDYNNAKTLEDFVNIACNNSKYLGYILITSDGSSTSNSSSTDSNKSNEDKNEKSDNSINSESSSITGDGKVITTSDYNATGGYSGIFQSGTTGKKFREYKQNSSYVAATYTSFDWTIECGTVTTIIMGSGYSKQANFSDANRRLHQGGTNISAWLEDYTGQKVTTLNSCSQDTLKKNMSDGCIVAIHSPNYTSAGHYMALLDISKDKSKVYLSNPWGGDDKWQRMG